MKENLAMKGWFGSYIARLTYLKEEFSTLPTLPHTFARSPILNQDKRTEKTRLENSLMILECVRTGIQYRISQNPNCARPMNERLEEEFLVLT